MNTETKPTRPVCGHCGSHHVHADAYAEWDTEAGRWALHSTYEKIAFCPECDGECRIEWEEFTPEPDPDAELIDRLRQAAIELHHSDGHIEIDSSATVSLSEDGGAYVQAWVWVADDE